MSDLLYELNKLQTSSWRFFFMEAPYQKSYFSINVTFLCDSVISGLQYCELFLSSGLGQTYSLIKKFLFQRRINKQALHRIWFKQVSAFTEFIRALLFMVDALLILIKV